jgi:hypothetical protein
MKFLHHLFSRTEPGFHNISGYDDIKDIVIRALDADENYNLLFIGPPASSKTLFLMGIQEIRKDAVYFDCSNTTSRILDVLQEERPKIILADEIDKLQNPIKICCSISWNQAGLRSTNRKNSMISLSRERKYLQRRTTYLDYPSHFRADSGNYFCPSIRNNNSYQYQSKYCPGLMKIWLGISEQQFSKMAAMSEMFYR